jgi:hypothetical protein
VKRERFNSKREIIFVGSAFLISVLILGYAENGLEYLRQAPIESASLILLFSVLIVDWKLRTYLEIQDRRWLVNSGYYTFWKQRFDILDIKYIYRYPNLVLKWYGSRMVFYIKGPDGKLRVCPESLCRIA